MDNKFRVGLLTTIDSTLLSFFISNLFKHKLYDIVVICDSKKITYKDKKIWQERTGGAFNKIDDINSMMLPFYFVNSHNDENTLDLINLLSVDVLLNAGTSRKLNKHILEATKHGVINIHPGLLPYYRECCAVEWSIFNDDKIDNAAHFMTEGYDEGNIIFSEWYKFPSDADSRQKF